MCPVRKIKEFLFGTREHDEERTQEHKPTEHALHEHEVTIYEEKPPALTYLKKPAQKKGRASHSRGATPRKAATKKKRMRKKFKKKAKKRQLKWQRKKPRRGNRRKRRQ
ncbi:MAG: hypothetical protein QXH30_03635 [Candidatus Bilamarchaeaceae archaeon]